MRRETGWERIQEKRIVPRHTVTPCWVALPWKCIILGLVVVINVVMSTVLSEYFKNIEK